MGKYNWDKTKIKEYLGDDAAREIIESFMAGFCDSNETKVAYNMTFKTICSFPQTPLTKEQQAELKERLEGLE